eukprot:14755796-Alexandrium_andersonii.AAC.1
MVKVAPLQIDRSVQRKDKAKRGLGVDSDAVFYRMVAEETGCTEWGAKQGTCGDEPEKRSYRTTVYEHDGRIWIDPDTGSSGRALPMCLLEDTPSRRR